MAIDRTAFNLLQDDDTTNTVGTLWTKNQVKTVVLDPIDAELALKAPLASPALTGAPTAPTAATGTNTTQLATTAFLQAAINAAPTTWVPTDLSGAGLDLAVGAFTISKYLQVGRVVFWQMDVTYPSTSDSRAALIGTLPFASTVSQWGATTIYSNYGAPLLVVINTGSSTLLLFNGTTMAQLTNANLSGKTVTLQGWYFK